ncbi:Alpha-ketoglutarate-dependent dioxygenase alkB 7, mitochondrial [Dermatophagoides pteronyssinus]|uniref:Alpha-ketoglutarate-dependent dioxygenase alkB 7, mitochondrial n=1 Tax=Dermatophagoides pteronyssinus TaxID=6956 RepID=A0ABQ8JBQ9_DERPT|nr:Alpha-ketoglutarate-dependent dioxygenase alkB 7, mitochondrial [Dermatophagoides pteronyssinus]
MFHLGQRSVRTLLRNFKLHSSSLHTTILGDDKPYFKLKVYDDHFESKFATNLKQIKNSMFVVPDFIDTNEEQSLLDEVENVFRVRRIRYEQTHWDDAIQNYRETEHLKWRPENEMIIERIRQLAFVHNTNHIKFVHILEIKADGFIKPHVDSVRFCGDTIAGISLLSDSVMRMRLESNRDIYVDVLLCRRSLYIMTGDARYLYAHEILDDKNSLFKEKYVKRDRRISIICRNEPIELTNSQ